MKVFIRILAILLVLCMILPLFFGCQKQKDITETPTPQPEEEYTEEFMEGYNQVVFYWKHNDSYENCDIWAWWDNKDGKGYLMHPCSYGAKTIIHVPEGVEKIGFIVRKDCSDPGGSAWGSATKDYEQDRFALIEGKQTVIYLKPGDPTQYSSSDGGKTLQTIQKFTLATMAGQNTFTYRVTPKATLTNPSQGKIFEGDRQLAVKSLSAMGRAAATGSVETEEPIDLTKTYRMEIEGYGSCDVIPMEIFDSQWFADNFHYAGSDLGATIQGEITQFKVWAPTASKVVLKLYKDGAEGAAYKETEMTLGEKGVWSAQEACGHGTYYTYTVTTALGTNETVDPYAKSAGVNGNRGMVIDLASTDPEGWGNAQGPKIESYNEAVIWEVHVRDFSNKITSSKYPGKYLAFTETGLVNENGVSVGVDYLKDLGITHVHLLPVYDYATVDESDPNSGFNWGYDPKNYNVPEGSYATDPYDGAVRVKEFKQMVMGLHEAGIGVIMDMVYNHTYDANSTFQKIVPYYYYRYTPEGANSSASGCGNDTASERYMFGKFMVDSTAYWVEEYDLDGLRFDLMGLHDLATMQNVETAVHKVNPHAILYGEGWTMGATMDGSEQANQSNIGKITPSGNAVGAIAVFNDTIRDGLKGSVFEKTGQGFINGSPNGSWSAVLFGIRGGDTGGKGWVVPDSMVINYMSAHDNNTLWDKLALSNPDATDEQRLKMNKLGAAILLSAKGTPFWQAGEEMLRTKGGDENSYKSPDSVNNINWSVLQEGAMEYGAMQYYKGLIQMRKAYSIFTSPNTQIVDSQKLGSGVCSVTMELNGRKALIILNPHNTALPYTLEGSWQLLADGDRAGAEVLDNHTGNIQVESISIRVYIQ